MRKRKAVRIRREQRETAEREDKKMLDIKSEQK